MVEKFSLSIFSRTSDINELNLPRTCITDFPDPNDLLNFKMIICPDEGYYKGGRFVFNFKVNFQHPVGFHKIQ
jgi:ubiquitin-conjugating enzyme E2 M